MKKTNNIGMIFLVIFIVAIVSTMIIALAQEIFGVVPVFAVATCSILFCFMWIVWTDHKNKIDRIQAHDRKFMSDEAFKEKYCK